MNTAATLADSLASALGIEHPALRIVAEMDPPTARTFAALAEAIRDDNSLSVREQALIQIAINATVVHLNGEMVRAYIRAALRAGATAGEIREVLQLTSVLGIHGTIPGAQILSDQEGGLEALEAGAAGPERTARAKEARAKFEEKRGPMTPAWRSCSFQVPDLVEAYADFSGVPWSTNHLEPRMKELVYIAIDLLPQHTHLEGTRVHMKKAVEKGASPEDVRSVVQMIAVMGLQTHMLALPILAEELEELGMAAAS